MGIYVAGLDCVVIFAHSQIVGQEVLTRQRNNFNPRSLFALVSYRRAGEIVHTVRVVYQIRIFCRFVPTLAVIIAKAFQFQIHRRARFRSHERHCSRVALDSFRVVAYAECAAFGQTAAD